LGTIHIPDMIVLLLLFCQTRLGRP